MFASSEITLTGGLNPVREAQVKALIMFFNLVLLYGLYGAYIL